jgi:hypothetical protein
MFLSQDRAPAGVGLVADRLFDIGRRGEVERGRWITVGEFDEPAGGKVNGEGVAAAVANDSRKFSIAAADAALAEQADSGGFVDVLDVDCAVVSGLPGVEIVFQVSDGEARRNQRGYLGQIAGSNAADQVGKGPVELPEDATAGAIVLGFFEAVEDEQAGAGVLEEAEDLVERDAGFLFCATNERAVVNGRGSAIVGATHKEWRYILVAGHAIAQPVGKCGEEGVRVGGVIEGEHKKSLRGQQVGTFRDGICGRKGAGEELEEAVGDGGFTGTADTDQGADARAASPPPVTDLLELGAILPVAGAEEGVDEVGLGLWVVHRKSAPQNAMRIPPTRTSDECSLLKANASQTGAGPAPEIEVNANGAVELVEHVFEFVISRVGLYSVVRR